MEARRRTDLCVARTTGTGCERKHRPGPDPSACPCCDSRLVQPTDWRLAGRSSWSVSLRCPECEWRGDGVYDQAIVDRYDEELHRGALALTESLEVLTRWNMDAEGERLRIALERDLVLPEDF